MLFWASMLLEDLAELQGVRPAGDLDQISALWPVDDDPDRMLAHILDGRLARRRVALGTAEPKNANRGTS
ncbi:MAG: hypothetical protein DI607_13755 [Sphingomonas hengshuiensis]|nr:MAG: hypothetical protein DI607_13755 [Sphingomonas hengshuiensis]